MDLAALIYQRLANDLPLAALLADYRDHPAIFHERVPLDAQPPWIVLDGVTADEPADARGLRLRSLRFALRCLAAAGEGGAALDAVAARARALLHGEELAATTGAVLAQSCAGPVAAATERGFLQRRLELRLLLNDSDEGEG